VAASTVSRTPSPGAGVAEPEARPGPASPEAGVDPGTGGTAPSEVLGTRPSRRRGLGVTVAAYLVTVFVLLTFNFLLPRLMPGDPIDALMSLGSPSYVVDDATRANLAEYYGLDKPLAEQYVDYLASLARGDLGVSIVSNQPVTTELGDRVGWSFLLIGSAMVLSLLIGIPTGIHSGWKRGKGIDRGLLGFFLSVQNLPIFFVGSVVLVVFAAQLGLFPLGGGSTAYSGYTGLRHVLDVAYHLALPALILAFEFSTYEYLVMRSAMVSQLGADYMLGGRAKGLRERKLKYGYAGRNALLPVVTIIGLQFSLAMTGIMFVERIFSYPGIGGYFFSAVGTRDYPAMQGAFLVLTFTVLSTSLAVDLLYRRLDPRTSS